MQRQGRFGLGILFLLAGCDSSGSKANGIGGSTGTAGAASGGSMTGPEAGAAAGTAGGASGGSMTTGGSGGRADAGATDRATEVCVAALKTYVERQAFCRGGHPIDYRPFAGACPEFLFGPDSNRTVDQMEACLSAWPCFDVRQGIAPACFRPGKRPNGAGCIFSSQCQSGSCGSNGDTCSFCLGTPSIGSSCDNLGMCEPDAYCDRPRYKCESKAAVIYGAEGQACDETARPPIACTDDLECTSIARAPSVCVKRGAATTPTPTPTPTCGDTTCDLNSFCKNETCVEYAKLGQPCAYSNTQTETLPVCALGLECLDKKCIQRRVRGEPCDDANPCAQFHACVAGVCQVIVCAP
jgi:hypothetical protein